MQNNKVNAYFKETILSIIFIIFLSSTTPLFGISFKSSVIPANKNEQYIIKILTIFFKSYVDMIENHTNTFKLWNNPVVDTNLLLAFKRLYYTNIEYNPIIVGQDIMGFWDIKKISFSGNTALINIYRYWNADHSIGSDTIQVKCTKNMGKWKISDINNFVKDENNNTYGVVLSPSGLDLFLSYASPGQTVKLPMGTILHIEEKEKSSYEVFVRELGQSNEGEFGKCPKTNVEILNVSRAITIGSSMYFVKAKLGKPIKENIGSLIYSPDDIILIKDGKVVGWMGFTNFKNEFNQPMSPIIFLLIIIMISSLWVFFDAYSIGIKKELISGICGNMGAWHWFGASLFFWVIAFPLYLFKRRSYQQAVELKSKKLDCDICKSRKTMIATNIPRFSTGLRLLGYLLFWLSISSLLLSTSVFFNMPRVYNKYIVAFINQALTLQSYINRLAGFNATPIVIVLGIIFGWVILLRRNVIRCQTCNRIIDRA